LILVDGKRVAQASLFGKALTSSSFLFDDRHIDILKDGASAVYGAAQWLVWSIFFGSQFRAWKSVAPMGKHKPGASNEMGEWKTWLKGRHWR